MPVGTRVCAERALATQGSRRCDVRRHLASEGSPPFLDLRRQLECVRRSFVHLHADGGVDAVVVATGHIADAANRRHAQNVEQCKKLDRIARFRWIPPEPDAAGIVDLGAANQKSKES